MDHNVPRSLVAKEVLADCFRVDYNLRLSPRMAQLHSENIVKETEEIRRKKRNKMRRQRVVADKNQQVNIHHSEQNEVKKKKKHKNQVTAKVTNGGEPSSFTGVKDGVNKKKGEPETPMKKKRKLEENDETKPKKRRLSGAESGGHTGADHSKMTAENSVHNVKKNKKKKSKINMTGYTCEEVGSGKSKNESMALRKGGAKAEKGGEHGTKKSRKNKGKALMNISTETVCAEEGAKAKEGARRNKGMKKKKKKKEAEDSEEIKVEENKMKNADMGVLDVSSTLMTKKVEKKKKWKAVEAGAQQATRKSEGEGKEKKKKAAVSETKPGVDIKKEKTENRERTAGGEGTCMKILTGTEKVREYDEGSTKKKKKVKIEILGVSDAGRGKENEDGYKRNKGIKTTEDGRKKRKRKGEKAEAKEENIRLNEAIKEEEGGPKKKKKMAKLTVNEGLPSDKEVVSIEKKREKKSRVLENGNKTKKEKVKKKELVEGQEVIAALRNDVSFSKTGKVKKMRKKQSEEDEVVPENGTRKNEEEGANNSVPLTKKKKKKSKEKNGQQDQDLKKRKKHKGYPAEEKAAAKGKKVKVEQTGFESEESLAQTDVVFLSEKMGNKDEVHIDRARREALQREIDRASSPSNSSNFGQWGTAHFDSPSQQQKFLRLMGGFKNGSTPVASSSGQGNMALGKDSQQHLQQELLGEFERAQNRRMNFQNKGAGLGFTAPSSKKFFIDVSASRSIKFEY